MTPPLILRDDEGSRSIVEVDDAICIAAAQQTPRTTAFLRFAPGLVVEVKSRCVNKRRVTVLCIRPQVAVERSPVRVVGSAFGELAKEMGAVPI